MAINILRRLQFFFGVGHKSNQASSGKFQEIPSMSSDAILVAPLSEPSTKGAKMRRLAFRHRRFDGMLVWRPKGLLWGSSWRPWCCRNFKTWNKKILFLSSRQPWNTLEMSCSYAGGSCTILHCFHPFALQHQSQAIRAIRESYSLIAGKQSAWHPCPLHLPTNNLS